MPLRPKLFLTFFVVCFAPLLILSLISQRSGLKTAGDEVRADLNAELAATTREFEASKRDRETELLALAHSQPMQAYLQVARGQEASLKDSAQQKVSTSDLATVDTMPERKAGSHQVGVRADLESMLGINRKYYTAIGVFGPGNKPLFVDEQNSGRPEGAIVFRPRDWALNPFQPDDRAWTAGPDQVICSVAGQASLGEILRCSVRVVPNDKNSDTGAVLVADVALDQLISGATREWDLPVAEVAGNAGPPDRFIIVIDPSARIVYHTNNALRHQLVSNSMPYFAPVAATMRAGASGSQNFESTAGERWIARYAPLKSSNLFLSVARNYSLASSAARRNGWLLISLSLVIGLAAALPLTHYLGSRMQRIERVSETVTAIARGDLEQRVVAPSRDDLRPIADSVNVMSERLRAQVAREAEAHQFQSFVKLSALLTHDLKNAIEALSLTVSNMEIHYDNPVFREDAMKGLASATDKLRALVARLSNPVNTLSGEFKMPRPTDLVPLLSRALIGTADPLSARHEIDLRLPATLFAMADGERIEKVMENLVLNAIEAMSGKRGKLTMAAGQAAGGKVFFSVTDTGVGMAPDFIQQKLFRPFATTKERGVGLGLYTCREVVRANGGTIEVESVPGSGTTVRVVLASAPSSK